MSDKIFEFAIRLVAVTKIPADTVNVPKADADTVFTGMLNLAYWAAGVTAVIVIVVAGIMFATADGSPDKIARARKAIVYSVVGLVIILFAAVITQFVIGKFN